MARMEFAGHVDAVAREVDGLVAALAAGPADAAVPTCPDWTVADLVEHVAGFTGFWTHVLCEGTGRPLTPFPDRPEGPALVEWYRGIGDALVSELRATAPDQAVWTWVEDRRNAAFVARRCAHELAVHRFDLQSARGTPQPVEPALAADGIEEIFVMVAAFEARGDARGRGGGEVLALEATDCDQRWLLTLAPTGLDVARRSGPADLTARAGVSDLELLCYRRPTLGEVHLDGDPGALDAWYRAFTF